MSDRHVIAVLFCDLVDSTAILSRIGDVANDELRRDFFTATRQAVTVTGGEEVKTQGDGLMATFRSPDDSVAAAIELQRAVSRLDARDRDVRLALRVGVAWGEATSEEDDWFGTPVVEAARLCGVARSGQVLLTEALRSALRHPDRIDLADEGGLTLKGLDGPRRTWSAAWARDEGGQVSVPPPLQIPMGSAFVGREDELAALRGCWDAVRNGATRVAVVHGPAGAGATRLVASLADEVRSDALVLYGRALEGGDGQEAFEEALRWFVTGTDRSRLRHVTVGLRPAIDDALPSVGVRLGPPPRGETSVDRDTADATSTGLGPDAALLTLLGRLSVAEPVLLVIDDAHLLGPVGVELLSRIADGDEGGPVLVAVLARSETGDDPDPIPGMTFLHGWLGSATNTVTEVALGPLPAGEAFELLGLEPDSEAARAAVEETGLVAARVMALRRQLDEAGHLRGATADDIRRAVARTSPYRGLAVFRAEDRDLFHGRSTLRNLALERLARSPVLVVVGASGSGKSSLVRAGVLPALSDGAIEGSADWPQVTITPGPDPLSRLDDARRASDGGVLFVDQLEEVVTRGGPVAVREEFLRRVLLSETGGPRIVIATLRADVLGAVVAVPGVAEVLDRATLLVPPMSATEMRAAIEQPAAAVGLRLESGLTELVLADVAAQPGSLPLVSHAMYGTWLRRRGNTLTVAAYREAGGVDGAVARTADSVHLGQFDDTERSVARSLLLALVEPGEGTDDSRRSATASELMGSGGSDGRQDRRRVERVLETLVSARLLSVDGETVDLAHESLIRAWPRLRGWLDEDREALGVHRRLGRAAAEWQEGGRDDAELYRGGRLAAATELSERENIRLSPDEKAFLDASEALRDREVTAAAERAAADRRANRRLKVILGVGAVALLVAAAAAVVAIRERNKTQSLADAADARSAALQIEGVAAGDPSLARLVAAEAYDLSVGPETTRALFEAVTADGRVTATIELPAASSPLLGVSTSGEVVSVQGNEVRRWHPDTGQLSGKVSLPEGSGEAFALSPDFSAVVTFPGTEDSADPTSTGAPDRVAVFGVDGKERWTAPLTVDATTLTSVPSATVSRGGSKVLLVGTTSVALAGPDGAGPSIDLPAGEGIRTAAISPDGDRAAVAVAQAPDTFVETAGGPLASPAGPTEVAIVDTATGKRIRTIAAASPVNALLFSGNGSVLAVGTVPSQPPMVSLDPKVIPDVGAATTFTVDVATGRRQDKDASAPGAPAAWVGTDLAVHDSTGWVSTWKPDLSEATGVPARYDATTASVAGNADLLLVGEATATRAQVTVRDRHRPHGVVTSPSGPPGLTQVAVSADSYVVSVRPAPDQAYTGMVVTVNDGDKVVAEKKGAFGGVGGGHVLLDGRLLRLPDLKPVGTAGPNRFAGGRLSPDGKFVAVLADGSLRLRDSRTGEDVTSLSEIETTVPPDPTIGPLAFSADGNRLLVRNELEQVTVFDLSSRSTVAEEAVAAGSDAISLSPDGSILAVGSLGGDVVLGDLDTSKSPTTLSGLGEAVGSISFLTGPDGESLVAVSGSESNTTILFDVSSGQQYGPALAVPVRQVAQNASGLVLASSAGLMKIPMDVDAWRDTACATAGRTLTRAESNRYFPGRSAHGSCGS